MNAKQIEQKFFEEIKSLSLSPTQKIGLGFSGGADSTLLLALCAKFLPKNSFEVIYFAHGDNPLVDNDSVAIDFCRKQVALYNLPLTVIDLALEKTKSGWEATGHTARKEYIFANYDAYFLGHHLDDRCENFFIQFFRGAGSAKILKSEAVLKRPLLSFTKEEIKNYLIHKKIEWLEDKTNENTDITRNFWRQNVLPLIEQHYPGYRERVNTALKVEEQNLQLIKDLALVDGLEQFTHTHQLVLNLELPERRLKNLLYFYCKHQGIHIQQATLDEVVKQIMRPNKELEIAFFSTTLGVKKDNKNKSLSLKVQPVAQPVVQVKVLNELSKNSKIKF